jgi:hypothetical protein
VTGTRARRIALPLLVVWSLQAPAVLGEGPALATRAFPIRYREVDDAIRLVRPLLGEGGSLTLQPRLRAITITDEPARLDRMAEVLAAFDVPPRRVNLAVSLIMGSKGDGGPSGEELERPRRAVPRLPGFDSTLRALEHTVWTDYRLLGSASFTAAEGEVSELSLGEEYRIRLRVDTVDPKHRVTRFDRITLERQVGPSGGGGGFLPIWDAVLNLKDDMLYVFGATRMEDSRRAIFLSVTAGIEE